MAQSINLKGMQSEIIASLGRETILQVHRENAAIDALAVIVPLLLFWGSFAALFWIDSFLVAIALSATQSALMSIMGLVNHDMFVHRRRGGPYLSWILGLLLTLPIQVPVSRYRHTHLQHHKYVGTEQDTELYKQDLTTRTRRLLFCTFWGIRRAMRGAWSREGRADYFDVPGDSPVIARRLLVERFAYPAFLLVMLSVSLVNRRPAVFGYFLPILILVPMLNTLRILIEHADLDPRNPKHIASYYRTGWLSRLLFLWDSGDCHLVHHIFPNIPFYRVGAALRLLHPQFEAWGIAPRRSYLALVKGWFVAGYGHRTRWPK